MKTLVHLFIALTILLLPAAARAAVSCSFQTIPLLNFVSYTPNTTYLTNTNNLRQMSVTALCTRTLAADSTTVYLGSDNGLYAQGQNNRMLFSGSYIIYDVYKDSGCSVKFRNNNNAARIAATIPATPLNTQHQVTFDFWGCITTAQATAAYPSGYYLDTISLVIVSSTGATLASGSMSVQDFTPATCSVTGGPGNLVFTYQAFGAADVRSSSFSANCSNNLAYTMTITPDSGAVGGVRYTLGLTALSAGTVLSIGPASLSDTGNVSGTRLYYVNGLVAAGQPGQAGTPVAQPHTLMLTY